MYDYDDDQDSGFLHRVVRAAGIIGLLVALCVAVWFFAGRDDSSETPLASGSTDRSLTESADGDSPGIRTIDSDTSSPTSAPTTNAPTRPPADTAAAPDASRSERSTSVTTATTAAASPAGAATSSAPTTSASSTSPTGSTITARPEPVLTIFDTDLITLVGSVPSQAAVERLHALARVTSKFPDAEIVDQLTVDPSTPLDVDVRVIELNSVRFPEGSTSIGPEHAAELDRVASFLDALPHVEALVIGHADQRGDAARNYVLSAGRAQSVVDHLVARGIEPSRLSSRAVGETDLLTLDDDDAALALNRRTEFVFTGALVDTGE